MPLIKQIELNWTNFHLTFHNHHRCLTAAMQCCFCLPNLNTIIKCSIHLAFDFLFLFVCVCVCVCFVCNVWQVSCCMHVFHYVCQLRRIISPVVMPHLFIDFVSSMCHRCYVMLCCCCSACVCVCVYSSGCVVGSICSHCLSNQPTDHRQAILTETVTIADRS